jgi:hypothetical protein
MGDRTEELGSSKSLISVGDKVRMEGPATGEVMSLLSPMPGVTMLDSGCQRLGAPAAGLREDDEGERESDGWGGERGTGLRRLVFPPRVGDSERANAERENDGVVEGVALCDEPPENTGAEEEFSVLPLITPCDSFTLLLER